LINPIKYMKTYYYPILFALLTTSCFTQANTENALNNQDVQSWKTLDPTNFNDVIIKASAENKSWIKKPEQYIFNILDLSNLKQIHYDLVSDNIEAPENITITLIRDGFLDDSVRGDIHSIQLIKNNQSWKISSVKQAIRCWRNDSSAYSSKACP